MSEITNQESHNLDAKECLQNQTESNGQAWSYVSLILQFKISHQIRICMWFWDILELIQVKQIFHKPLSSWIWPHLNFPHFGLPHREQYNTPSGAENISKWQGLPLQGEIQIDQQYVPFFQHSYFTKCLRNSYPFHFSLCDLSFYFSLMYIKLFLSLLVD